MIKITDIIKITNMIKITDIIRSISLIITIYNLESKTIIATFSHTSRARFIAWHPNGNEFAAAFDNGAVQIFKLPTPDVAVHTISDFVYNSNSSLQSYGYLTGLEYSLDGGSLLVTSMKDRLFIYETINYSIIESILNVASILFAK